MACHLAIYDPEAGNKQTYVCDEENAGKIVEDDHAASQSGEYGDVEGNKFQVDWTKQRLVSFKRTAN